MSDTPTTGDTIRSMTEHLGKGSTVIVVERAVLQGWHDCVVEAAAHLDPDNPPLTLEQLSRMQHKK